MDSEIPANEMPEWYTRGMQHLWLPYAQMKTMVPPLAVARTEGTRIILEDGRELVDGIASWWTAAHGYNHPHILDAMKAQMDKLPHAMFGGMINEPAATLSARLADILPGDIERCFIAESGSVSVEVAMKMAVQYFLNKGERRTKFVHFRGSYHGDTLGTMAIADPDEGMHSMFAGVLAEHQLSDLPRSAEEAEAFAEMLMAGKNNFVAVIMEPLVQGAGGMVMHTPETLRWIRQACDAAGVLLIIDEIFTGFGRTGTMFACDQAGVVPDMITLSKALTGGVTPLSICAARSHVFDAFWDDDPSHALMHGPTYMGHALGCAAANASLDLFLSENRLQAAADINVQLTEELEVCRGLPGVKDVRTLGAIGVVQLNDGSGLEALKPKFVDMGVWIRPFRDIVYLTPALTITPDDLSTLTHAIHTVLSE